MQQPWWFWSEKQKRKKKKGHGSGLILFSFAFYSRTAVFMDEADRFAISGESVRCWSESYQTHCWKRVVCYEDRVHDWRSREDL